MALPDEPITRTEKYLDNLAGGSATLPEKPITRIEQYLAYLVENGGGGGSVTPEEIAEAVAAYLDEHGVTVTEEDPTVPSWAKASTKPTYTAQEVGALPASTTIPSTAADVGAAPADVILVQDAQPTSLTNKLWIKETASGPVQIPEMSDIADFVASSTIETIWVGTQAEYDLIVTPSATTLYLIKEATT